ncbi:S41 family peptidase [Clostridium sp. ZS2-4]|uniref:S41 family peptidase n=1 Tax=Clostridium sp. ZS2-4 TaxID=2987703 RepID=UPI00227C028C|nr:S41 family peptidase [Clostridium sp. ZS2-4]MCY6354555.1 S41 family peptidase [Clostridium sp. ZS2-4]
MDHKEINNDYNKNKSKDNSKKNPKILIVAVIVILTNLTTFIAATRVPIKGTMRISKQTYDEISKFNKMFIIKDNLEKYYDGKIDEEALVNGAIKGMTESLNDPYTIYMNQEDYKNFNVQTEGNYVGIGIQIDVKDNKIVVVAPFEDSPAKKVGIMTGDIIEKVNSNQVSGKEVDKAISMIKGEKNTYVVLTVRRGNEQPRDIKVKRDVITLTTVKGEMLDEKIAYIQITTFDEHTADQFDKETSKLKKQGMKGIILDLRQNPGGWLTQCNKVTSNFLQKGKLIVSTKDKNGNEEKFFSEGGNLIGVPLVVLTDGGTASASEIFSGAVRDYKLGTLVGTKTFGKGIVQSVLDKRKYGFGDGTALKVTTSKYYTPNGENIHHIGIKPNIEVKYPEELLKKSYDRNTDPQFNKALQIIKEKMK